MGQQLEVDLLWEPVTSLGKTGFTGSSIFWQPNNEKCLNFNLNRKPLKGASVPPPTLGAVFYSTVASVVSPSVSKKFLLSGRCNDSVLNLFLFVLFCGSEELNNKTDKKEMIEVWAQQV